MTIKDWLEGLPYKLVQGSLDVEVNEVVYDSRKAAPGAVFVCMKGTKIDSHDFIPQVTEAGVKVLVTEHPVEAPEGVTVVETENGREALALLSAARFGYSSRKLTMIGVTGTKGKTTTTHMIKTILETCRQKDRHDRNQRCLYRGRAFSNGEYHTGVLRSAPLFRKNGGRGL